MHFTNRQHLKRKSQLNYKRGYYPKDNEDLFVWFAVLLLIVSGFLLSLSFAPYNARFFAYVSFIPLFFIITRSSSYKKVFLLGLLFGFIFFFFHLWWLYFLMVPVTKATKILLYLGITILLGYLALYVAIFSLLTKFFGLLWAPLIWALLEFLRTKSEIGFPWALLGASQTPYTPLIQIASIFGVYGLSSWVILVNLLFYYLLIKKRRLLYLISILLVFFVPLGYGILRVKKNTFAFKVALVQPNVHPNEKGDRASRERLTEELIYLIKKAIKEQPKLIILPETATLVDITKDQELARRFQSLADENGVYIFSGTPIYERYSNVYYNGAVLLEPKFYPRSDSNYELISVEFSKIYRKIRLVPFSERIPFIDKIPFMRYLETVDMGSCSPGHEYTIFELEDTLPVNKFAALICFESIFPDLARNFVIRGAQFLVNITNDGWFGNTPGPYEHCELAILRAVENGVPLLRCANNGITLIADPYGRILKKTTLFSMKVLTGEVPQPLKTTIYRQYGDFFIVGAACLAMIGLIVNIIIKIKKKPKRF